MYVGLLFSFLFPVPVAPDCGQRNTGTKKWTNANIDDKRNADQHDKRSTDKREKRNADEREKRNADKHGKRKAAGEGDDKRIMNGVKSGSGEFPWLCYVLISHTVNGEEVTYQCGCSLIDRQWALTAAHCVQFG